MIAVSDAWKAAHRKPLLPETHIEITYTATEPGAQLDATASATLESDISKADTLVSPASVLRSKYATLEWAAWGLDGSFEYYNPSTTNPGYVTSNLSNDSCEFEGLPTITISFSKVHTVAVPGITIIWSEEYSEWATKYRVTAYNGSTAVSSYTVDGDTSPVSYVWLGLENYDKIVIEVLAWSMPRRRARAMSVIIGHRNIYTKNDLFGYSHEQTVDLLTAAMPKNEVSFRLRNDDDRWNPNNPAGVEQYLIERQKIKVRYGMTLDGAVEWIDAGEFWLSEWETPSNGIEAIFTARDVFGFMDVEYTGPTSGTLYSIASAAFEQADLPVMDDGGSRYVIDDTLKNYTTEFADGGYTIAEVLQRVAHMACCVLYQGRDGVVRLEPRGTVKTDYEILQEFSYTHPEFDISRPLKAVSASYGDNQRVTVSVAGSGEVQTVDNDFIRTQADAQRVASATATILAGRKTVSGEYRADPRLDALDIVTVQNKYATNEVVITGITYSTTGGALRGEFTGRVI